MDILRQRMEEENRIFQEWKVRFFSIFAILLCCASSFAQSDSTRRMFSWNLCADYGKVLQTNDFVKGGHFNPQTQEWSYSDERKVENFSAVALQFEWGLRKNDWRRNAYRNPYYGIAFYRADFKDARAGNPFSLYFLYGAEIFQIRRWLTWNYEFNLGYSSHWNHYDKFDNPDNVAIGGSSTVHVGVDTYLQFLIAKHWVAKLGVALTHFSNGAMKNPNRGLNLASPFFSVGYRINEDTLTGCQRIKRPRQPYRIDHDFILTASMRHIYFVGTNTRLKTAYVDYPFHVYAFSYAAMFSRSYKYKFGPSLDFKYDESIGAKADYVYNDYDEYEYNRVWKGKAADRFSLGISLKGEIVMPYFSFFTNLGYEFWHKDERSSRFYQQLGIKVQPYGNIFGIVGIRANYFSKAQYICWSVGYTLKGKGIQQRLSEKRQHSETSENF